MAVRVSADTFADTLSASAGTCGRLARGAPEPAAATPWPGRVAPAGRMGHSADKA